jgi:hypothetical protein
MTTVINVKVAELRKQGYANFEEWATKPNHVYIGRNMSFYVKGANASKWQNPFNLKKYSLEESLRLYKEHILNNAELLASIEELRGKTLGCWCKPNGCHGDVLIEILTSIQ